MNIENCLHSMILYNEYTKLCIFFEKLYTFNIKNFVLFLKKNYTLNILKNCVLKIYLILYFCFWKIIYIEYIELCTFFDGLNIKCINLTLVVLCGKKIPPHKKLCTLNILNCVHSLKNCAHWICKIIYILWKIVYVEDIKLSTFF